MHSLFTHDGQIDFLQRIHSLSPDSQPKWGKMTVGQMFAHNQEPLKIAFREKPGGWTILGFLFGSRARRKFVNTAEQFGKNLPTAFKQTGPKDFEVEKARLIEYVARFRTLGPAGLTTEKHPFFGDLTTDEWDYLTLKHLDHHFRQFGV